MRLRNWRTGTAAAAIFLTLLAALGYAISPVQAATLGPVQNVSHDAGDSINPRAAQDPDGNVHIVWDSGEGGSTSHRILYVKGTWNGSDYSFGSTSVIADIGGFQYGTPNIAVAPNGTAMASWSDGKLRIKTWNSRDAQPGGESIGLGNGIQASIATDSSSQFHIVWNGDFNIQYCQWNGSACTKRDAFSPNEANRPDITVDSHDGVHLVWDKGNGIKYRARAANSEWGNTENLSGGNYAQITSDASGNVYIAWSRDFNTQFCQRTLGSGCTGFKTFDSGNDFGETFGSTPDGSLLLVWRDGNKLRFVTREGGSFSSIQSMGNGVQADVSPHSYVGRISTVWSNNFDIQHQTVNLGGPVTPVPTVTPTLPPTPTPIPVPQGTISIVPQYTSIIGIPGVGATFNVSITSTGAPPTQLHLQSGSVGQDYAWAPDANNTMVVQFTFPAGSVALTSQCLQQTLTATLTGPSGTSQPFSANILVDPDVQATVHVRNPNSTSEASAGTTSLAASTNGVPNAFGPQDGGDPSYTRSNFYYLAIAGNNTECSGVAEYAITYTHTPDPRVPLNVTQMIPLDRNGDPGVVTMPSTIEGEYTFYVTVKDRAGNVKNWPDATHNYKLIVDYDKPVATLTSPGRTTIQADGGDNGVTTLHVDNINVSDNLYPNQSTQTNPAKEYWGYWVLVKPTNAGAPTDAQWVDRGAVIEGQATSTTRFNLAMGMVGGFSPGAQYTIYIRYLDGAGNAANALASDPVTINSLTGPRLFLPFLPVQH